MRTLLAILLVVPIICFSQSSGESIFQSNCAACHSIGKGRLVGPDLEDVSARRSGEWIIRFIKSSQSMIAEGDSLALALFKEYSFVPMPDQTLNESEISEVIKHIDSNSRKSAKNIVDEKKPQVINSEKNVDNDWFTKAFFNPITWIIGFILIAAFFIVFIMSNVIKTLIEYIAKLRKDSRK